MPVMAYLAPLFDKNPTNPEDMLEWPIDLVNQMLWYTAIAKTQTAELSGP